jgi:hypothetical protein
MIGHRPADDPAAVEVHDGSQIEPALIGLYVGDVGEPDPVRRGGREVPPQQVRGAFNDRSPRRLSGPRLRNAI